jgi:Transposase, Mutator family
VRVTWRIGRSTSRWRSRSTGIVTSWGSGLGSTVTGRGLPSTGCGRLRDQEPGPQDCLIVVCDGLKGLPEAVTTVWPQTIVQPCIVHLLRNSFKYASKKDWAAIARDLKPVYTAASESAALDAFAEFSEKWEKKYPAIIRLWTNA